MGIHGEAAPFLFNDALWGPALRNVFTTAHASAAALVPPEQTIEALQQRGVRFVICMNTIGSTSRKLSSAGLGSYDEISCRHPRRSPTRSHHGARDHRRADAAPGARPEIRKGRVTDSNS